MIRSSMILISSLAIFLNACGPVSFGTNDASTSTASIPSITTPGVSSAPSTASGANVLAVDVGNCGPYSYFNEPCVSVTICTPGTSNCQTINNVLLDTGSYGLRIFSSVITVALTQENDPSGNPIAECTQFGTGAEWGPIQKADVILGGEPAVTVPIQVVNSGFASVPSNCTDLDSSPAATGFNGILGVGLFNQDCGSGCVSSPTNGVYFSCSGSSCGSIAIPLAQQVANPVAFLPQDNNGVIVQLPAVASGGAPAAEGYLLLGIGTQPNNTTQAVSVFAADAHGNFTTQFNGHTYSSSFIDSGSNGLFFPDPSSLAECGGQASGFFCPASLVSFQATQISASGASHQELVSFQIGNAESDLSSSNTVFNNIGGAIGGVLSTDFDWGLPFFLGRSVFVGIDGKSSNLASGPYWAY